MKLKSNPDNPAHSFDVNPNILQKQAIGYNLGIRLQHHLEDTEVEHRVSTRMSAVASSTTKYTVQPIDLRKEAT